MPFLHFLFLSVAARSVCGIPTAQVRVAELSCSPGSVYGNPAPRNPPRILTPNKLSPTLSAPSVTDSGQKSSPHLFFSESKKGLLPSPFCSSNTRIPPRESTSRSSSDDPDTFAQQIRKQGQQANKLCQKGRLRGTAPGVMHPTHRASGLSGASRVRRRDRAGCERAPGPTPSFWVGGWVCILAVAAARGALVHRARDPATMDPDARVPAELHARRKRYHARISAAAFRTRGFYM